MKPTSTLKYPLNKTTKNKLSTQKRLDNCTRKLLDKARKTNKNGGESYDSPLLCS